ncbi:glucan biosynthesis protein G [Lysobacter ciconiae]|uniref:Glucans biosynthesis protein D n=1 Tax=Novilysobacter ciconiae TaxID=2781022 RepID=A0A7S6UES0_9GAMM|nr:glucan biosynthesis protein G [Lysobacter ciconiae]QOW18982.1 glucan biosynthesis protein G [Lysobacter ciconiae]
MDRRELLIAGLSLPLAALVRPASASPLSFLLDGGAQAAALTVGTPFGADTVPALARELAAQPFQPASSALPEALRGIGYDQYRDIRFDPSHSLWRADGRPFQAQFFHRGFLHAQRVEIHEVIAGIARPVTYSPDLFTFGAASKPDDADLGFAGFRLHAPINRPDYFDEVCAFLGASYFRAVGRGQRYGLSARGLALGTADPAGEEFPVFKAFWLERPAPGAAQIRVHALMDSPSAAAAFTFVIHPGADTVFDVSMRLYPRVDLARAGIAPLTSMFQFDAGDRVGIDDYRAAVHDSDGLALLNGAGEQLWRPLRNPASVQESLFLDRQPRGFGLMQRKRAFNDYGDSEARYDLRPSAWVEPQGDWGDGAVYLFELPTADEYHDNIVAFWRPRKPLVAGREHRFDYRLHWCDRHPWNPLLARAEATRVGAVVSAGRLPTAAAGAGARRFVIDLAGGGLQDAAAASAPHAEVDASAGRVANVVAQPGAVDGTWRIAFELDPGSDPVIELRARLLGADGTPLSETWLYRWTA